jgi:hypothetical protein
MTEENLEGKCKYIDNCESYKDLKKQNLFFTDNHCYRNFITCICYHTKSQQEKNSKNENR